MGTIDRGQSSETRSVRDAFSMGNLPSPVLIVGAAHSGKSELAITALDRGREALVIGTADVQEASFAARINELKALRPGHWRHLETSSDLPGVLARAVAEFPQILIDSLSQWVAARLIHDTGKYDLAQMEERLAVDRAELLRTIGSASQRIVLVTSEVGAGTTPPTGLERLYRQQCGRLNLELGKAAASVVLVSAGVPLIMKG